MRLSGGRLLDLPAKIVSAFGRDKEPDQSTSLFYYLFVPASGEAFGTEHYFAGYRIMRPDEIDLAIGALDFGEVSDVYQTSVQADFRLMLH